MNWIVSAWSAAIGDHQLESTVLVVDVLQPLFPDTRWQRSYAGLLERGRGGPDESPEGVVVIRGNTMATYAHVTLAGMVSCHCVDYYYAYD